MESDTKKTELEPYTQYVKTTHGQAYTCATLGDISLLDRSMYYWAATVQSPIEHQKHFGDVILPTFTPLYAFHMSMINYFPTCTTTLIANVSKIYISGSPDIG